MTNKKLEFGILAIVLVFAMAVIGCDNGSSGTGGNSNVNENNNVTAVSASTFTVTDIPSDYHGKYVILFAGTGRTIVFGGQSISEDVVKGIVISNGKVNIPLWNLSFDEQDNTKPPTISGKYSGNNIYDIYLMIYSQQECKWNDLQPDFFCYFESVRFTNGGAAKSWIERIDDDY